MAKKGESYKHPPNCGHCKGGWKWSQEAKDHHAAIFKGHEVSEEARHKIANSLKAGDWTGERSGSWTGDKVTRSGIHQRAKKALPHECALSDATCKGVLDVAFRHDTVPARFRKESPMGPWSPRIEDYWRLCRSHHRRYDKAADGRKRDARGRLAPN